MTVACALRYDPASSSVGGLERAEPIYLAEPQLCIVDVGRTVCVVALDSSIARIRKAPPAASAMGCSRLQDRRDRHGVW
jgi:hypothetical protein